MTITYVFIETLNFLKQSPSGIMCGFIPKHYTTASAKYLKWTKEKGSVSLSGTDRSCVCVCFKEDALYLRFQAAVLYLLILRELELLSNFLSVLSFVLYLSPSVSYFLITGSRSLVSSAYPLFVKLFFCLACFLHPPRFPCASFKVYNKNLIKAF